ncbi:transposase [uncultured Bacteroides sp.]|uniref:transposase n=1 Tax=uncultured Bacteroides sp. TaxID=162156 RepID=UPI003457A87D
MMGEKQYYSEEEKLSLLDSYYHSGLSKRSFCVHHGLCGTSLLNKWLRKYDSLLKSLPLSSDQEASDMANRSKEDYKDENAHLKKRVKELEKALAFSKLETEARDLLITRAEEYFKIPIRKKSGAKR